MVSKFLNREKKNTLNSQTITLGGGGGKNPGMMDNVIYGWFPTGKILK